MEKIELTQKEVSIIALGLGRLVSDILGKPDVSDIFKLRFVKQATCIVKKIKLYSKD